VCGERKRTDDFQCYDPERDREAKFRFGQDTGAAARVYLAFTKWQLGEVGPTRALIEEAVAHAVETGHVPTLVHTYFFKAHGSQVRISDPRCRCREG
jgi:hypothetical protein